MTKPLLQEKDIILRAVEPDDLDFIYLAENDTLAWHTSATVAPLSRYMIQQYIDTYRADLYQDRQLRLIATLSGTGEQIGIADLYDFDPRNSRAGVGIYITPSQRCKGYGKKLLSALSHYAQEYIGIHMLYAFISVDNDSSRHIFNHCGYTQVATLPCWIKTSQGYTSAVIVQKSGDCLLK